MTEEKHLKNEELSYRDRFEAARGEAELSSIVEDLLARVSELEGPMVFEVDDGMLFSQVAVCKSDLQELVEVMWPIHTLGIPVMECAVHQIRKGLESERQMVRFAQAMGELRIVPEAAANPERVAHCTSWTNALEAVWERVFADQSGEAEATPP